MRYNAKRYSEARTYQLKPRYNTVAVVEMMTWQFTHLLVNGEVLQANIAASSCVCNMCKPRTALYSPRWIIQVEHKGNVSDGVQFKVVFSINMVQHCYYQTILAINDQTRSQ